MSSISPPSAGPDSFSVSGEAGARLAVPRKKQTVFSRASDALKRSAYLFKIFSCRFLSGAALLLPFPSSWDLVSFGSDAFSAMLISIPFGHSSAEASSFYHRRSRLSVSRRAARTGKKSVPLPLDSPLSASISRIRSVLAMIFCGYHPFWQTVRFGTLSSRRSVPL